MWVLQRKKKLSLESHCIPTLGAASDIYMYQLQAIRVRHTYANVQMYTYMYMYLLRSFSIVKGRPAIALEIQIALMFVVHIGFYGIHLDVND